MITIALTAVLWRRTRELRYTCSTHCPKCYKHSANRVITNNTSRQGNVKLAKDKISLVLGNWKEGEVEVRKTKKNCSEHGLNLSAVFTPHDYNNMHN